MKNFSLEQVLFVQPVIFSPDIRRYPDKLELYQLRFKLLVLHRKMLDFLGVLQESTTRERLLDIINKLSESLTTKPKAFVTSLDLMVAAWTLRTELEIFPESKEANQNPKSHFSNANTENEPRRLIETVNSFYIEAEKILLETIKTLYQFYFPQEGLELFEYRLKTKEKLEKIFAKDYGHVEIPFVWQVATLIQDLPFTQDPDIFKQNAEMILKVLEPIMPPSNFYKALAIAHGANLIDQLAEEIRQIGTNNSSFFDDENNIQTVPENVFRALQGDLDIATNPNTWQEVCSYMPPFVKIEKLLELVQNHDLESIIVAGLKLQDKIASVNQKLDCELELSAEEKISAYQDSMAMLYLYGPLVEMAGFRDLASEFMSVALEFLNRQKLPPELFSRLKEIYEVGRKIYNEVVTVSEGLQLQPSQGLALILESMASSLIRDIFGSNTIVLGHSNPVLDTLSRRFKSFGSYLEKFLKYLQKLKQIGHSDEINVGTPDQIGIKVIIPQNASAEQVTCLISQLITKIKQLNLFLPLGEEQPASTCSSGGLEVSCTIEHIRKEPPISFINCYYQEFEGIKAQIQKQFPEIEISYEGRNTEYAAIHVNAAALYSRIKIGFEIQIVRAEDSLENTYGSSSHAAYKAKINPKTDPFKKLKFMAVSIALRRRHEIFFRELKEGLPAQIELCEMSASRLCTNYGVSLAEIFPEWLTS